MQLCSELKISRLLIFDGANMNKQWFPRVKFSTYGWENPGADFNCSGKAIGVGHARLGQTSESPSQCIGIVPSAHEAGKRHPRMIAGCMKLSSSK